MEKILITVAENQTGKRLDVFMSEQLPAYSRAFFKRLIDDGYVLVNGLSITKAGYVLKLNDQVTYTFPAPKSVDMSKDLTNVFVEIVYEHADFLIINKPAGLVVHAPQKEYIGITLVDWLLHYFKDLKTVGAQDRPGIVHRLDMHTSGLMIIPTNNQSHAIFTNMFKDRQISKTYLAVTTGHPDQTGQINYPIVRHPSHRNRMTHVLSKELTQNWAKQARHAQTNYRVLNYLPSYSLVAVQPVTGRTHQIRVHMAAIGHVLVGDIVYGHKTGLISRQALHAYKLVFSYQGQVYEFIAQPPADFNNLLGATTFTL